MYLFEHVQEVEGWGSAVRSKVNNFEYVWGAETWTGTTCEQNDWRTDTTENITLATPLAGGKYLSPIHPLT